MKQLGLGLILLPIIGLAEPILEVNVDPHAIEALDCLIEPSEVIEVSSHLEAILSQVTVDKGDLVTKDDPLAYLESSVEEANVRLSGAKAKLAHEIAMKHENLKLKRKKFSRMDRLYKKQAVALDNKDEAETDFHLADLELQQIRHKKTIADLEFERAQKALAIRVIRSPINGVVIDKYLSAGESVADKEIVRVAQINPLRVTVIVPARYFGKIKNGMQAKVLPEIDTDNSFIADVNVVDRVIDASSGTFDVRLKLTNPGYKIPSGQKCRVVFLPNAVERIATQATPEPKQPPSKSAKVTLGGRTG